MRPRAATLRENLNVKTITMRQSTRTDDPTDTDAIHLPFVPPSNFALSNARAALAELYAHPAFYQNSYFIEEIYTMHTVLNDSQSSNTRTE